MIPTGKPSGLTPSQLNYAETAQWKQVIRQALSDTRCASPGFLVQDMDYVKQTVSVQIAIQERVRTVKGAQWWDVPPITNVPVILPRGGGYSLTLPLKKDTEGLLVFCDTCFDNWWLNGQNSAPKADNVAASSGSQKQFEVRRHYIHDCGFLPGMWSQPNVLSNYASNSAQLRADDGTTTVDVAEGAITLSANAVEVTTGTGTPLALMNDVFYQWYVANVQPFLVSKGYTGPSLPSGAETTVLKAE